MAIQVKARDVLKKIDKCKGNIIGVTVRGCGSQWVRLIDAKIVRGHVEFTVKMITHNASKGIKKVRTKPETIISYQSLDGFLRWCKMYDIESNHEF